MSRSIRTLVVDDEPIARRRLRRLLADEADVEIVGECANADDAAALLAARPVDLVLLDIQMPGGDGFSLLERVRAAGRALPLVVFVTAFDDHAVRAFEVAAVDYLVKPFARERVAEAIARVRRQSAQGAPRPLDAAAIEALVARIHPTQSFRSRVLVRSVGKVSFVPVDQIHWIEADGNYVRLHTAHGRQLARETLSRLARELDPAKFVRVHRGAIVALDHVRELERSPTGDHALILDSGARLTLSRSHREAFERAVEGRADLASA